MNIHWRLALLGALSICAGGATAAAVTSEINAAPFTNEDALREFSNVLIDRIGSTDLAAAEAMAKNNSHLDDVITQQNLSEVFAFLKRTGVGGSVAKTYFVQESKFGRSFIRHQYSLDNAKQSLRCMLTYRWKTDGWRLNQLWCR